MKRPIKVKMFFAWYDFWIGGYYDRKNKKLYICPIPTIVFQFWREEDPAVVAQRLADDYFDEEYD